MSEPVNEDAQPDITVAKNRTALPIVLRTIKSIASICGCSMSGDAVQVLVDSVNPITRSIVRNNRLLVVSHEVSSRLGAATVVLNKSYMDSLLGQLDVPKIDRPKYINSVKAAITMCIESSCTATKKMRDSSKTPIVPDYMIGTFVKHYTY